MIVEHAHLRLKWMEHQEKTQTSKATIVALPERGEYFQSLTMVGKEKENK